MALVGCKDVVRRAPSSSGPHNTCRPRQWARRRRKIAVGRCGTACGTSGSGLQPIANVDEPGSRRHDQQTRASSPAAPPTTPRVSSPMGES
jgi:hypothetical protein